MQKIFVFKNQYTGENSAADIKELLTRYGIFHRPDVTYSQLTENFDGLKGEEIMVALPGGSAVFMGRSLVSAGSIPVIQSLSRRGCHFVNICAGAILSTENAEIFNPSYRLDASGTAFELPSYLFSTIDHRCHLDITPDYTTMGPFYPTNAYIGRAVEVDGDTHKNKLHPYAVTVSLNGERITLPQLFVEGCGFELNATVSYPEFTIEATYQDHQTYSFFYPEKHQTKTLTNFPAMLTRKADPVHQKGGVLLAGTHVEACVENSHLLRFFRQPSSKSKAHLLTDNEHEQLLSSQVTVREKIISLMRRTFNTT